MAGLLSQIFDSADSASFDANVLPDVGTGGEDGGATAGSDDTGDSSGNSTSTSDSGTSEGDGTSGYGTSGENSVGTNFDLNPSVSLHTDMGGSIETLDGTTHSWSDSQDVSLTADVGAMLGASSDYAIDSIES